MKSPPMPTLELKPTHKIVTTCYDSLAYCGLFPELSHTAYASASGLYAVSKFRQPRTKRRRNRHARHCARLVSREPQCVASPVAVSAISGKPFQCARALARRSSSVNNSRPSEGG